jgi:putative ABC transport system permease protein
MIKFLIKGLLRDHHRSLFPLIVASIGVMLTTIIYSYINGEMNDLVDSNAKFETGHLKIITQAYKKISNQIPNDLALNRLENLMGNLKQEYQNYDWAPRIKFVGLLDVPDENGETKTQQPVYGIAINLFSINNNEVRRLNLEKAIVAGNIPKASRQILLSDELAKRMKIEIGKPITLLSTGATGAMAVQNFILSGTVYFGIAGMDRGAMIGDLSDMQYTLEMPDGASEVLGFSKSNFYAKDETEKIKNDFNSSSINYKDEFSPVMITLSDQNGLGEWLMYVQAIGFLIVCIFLTAMSIVLLNTGLMSGIRRYGEVGVRLALGEAKDKIYKTIIYESLLVGTAGSIIGTALGLSFSYYLQEIGIDITGTLRNSSIMMPNVLRAKINFTSYYIGFIPGLLSTLIGTIFSGIQIFKRQTASLFKELEA